MEIYIAKNKTQMGPYDVGQITQMLQSGLLLKHDLYWHEGMLDWAPVSVLQTQLKRQTTEQSVSTNNTASSLPSPPPAQNNQTVGGNMNGVIAGALMLNAFRNNQIHEDLRDLNHNIHDAHVSHDDIDLGANFDSF